MANLPDFSFLSQSFVVVIPASRFVVAFNKALGVLLKNDSILSLIFLLSFFPDDY